MSSGLPIGHQKYKPFVVDVAGAMATFGDVNFIDYGGQILVLDADGDPYLEIIEPPTDDEAEHGDWKPDAKWTVYRVEPEQFRIVEQDRCLWLASMEWKPDWPGTLASREEWFHKDLESIAEHEGVSLQEIRGWFCSEDPIERARAYLAVAAVHGWYEFDQYPLQLNHREVCARYGEDPPAMKIKLDNLDKDDGTVTVYCSDRQAALDDQTIEGSRWEAPGDLDVAYAVITDRPCLITALEQDGYEVDISDYVEPDGH